MASYRPRHYLTHPRKAYREFVYWPVRSHWQLARRGWADSDVWHLDSVLCARLGAQLLYLADIAHGWPEAYAASLEDWQAALRANGQALLDYHKQPGYAELLMKWQDLKFGGERDILKQLATPDAPESSKASAELRALEERLETEAQAALHWVADHLGGLWD